MGYTLGLWKAIKIFTVSRIFEFRTWIELENSHELSVGVGLWKIKWRRDERKVEARRKSNPYLNFDRSGSWRFLEMEHLMEPWWTHNSRIKDIVQKSCSMVFDAVEKTITDPGKPSRRQRSNLSAAKIWQRTFSFDTHICEPSWTTSFKLIFLKSVNGPYKISERTFRNRLRDILNIFFCFFCIITCQRIIPEDNAQ